MNLNHLRKHFLKFTTILFTVVDMPLKNQLSQHAAVVSLTNSRNANQKKIERLRIQLIGCFTKGHP